MSAGTDVQDTEASGNDAVSTGVIDDNTDNDVDTDNAAETDATDDNADKTQASADGGDAAQTAGDTDGVAQEAADASDANTDERRISRTQACGDKMPRLYAISSENLECCNTKCASAKGVKIGCVNHGGNGRTS